MLIRTSERPPRITDFGLAKRLRGDFGLTITGQVLGSPGIMPPEQTSGKSRQVVGQPRTCMAWARSLSLGDGRPRFQAATIEQVLQQLREQEPFSPRLLECQCWARPGNNLPECWRKNPPSGIPAPPKSWRGTDAASSGTNRLWPARPARLEGVPLGPPQTADRKLRGAARLGFGV